LTNRWTASYCSWRGFAGSNCIEIKIRNVPLGHASTPEVCWYTRIGLELPMKDFYSSDSGGITNVLRLSSPRIGLRVIRVRRRH